MPTEAISFTSIDEAEKKQLIQVLQTHFGVNDVEHISQYNEPTPVSRIFRVNTKDTVYLLKHLLWRPATTEKEKQASHTAHAFIEKLTAHFQSQGLPVPLPAKDVAVEDQNFFSLHPFVLGEHATTTKAELEDAGRLLAQFHQVGLRLLEAQPNLYEEIPTHIPFDKPFEDSVPVWEQLKQDLAEGHACSKPEVCAYFKRNIPHVDKLMRFVQQHLHPKALQQGICHMDFHPNNTLVRQGKIVAMLDFDNLAVAPLADDVANSLMHFVGNAIHQGVWDSYKEATRAFLAGYNSVRLLSAEELQSLVPYIVRWELMRSLRSLRRHYYEGDRLPGLLDKLPKRIFPNALTAVEHYGFLMEESL